MAQALPLEKTVAPILYERPGMLSCRDLSASEQAYRAIARPYYQMTHFVLWLSRHPLFSELAIQLLDCQPALFEALLTTNMSLIPLRHVIGKSPGVR